MNKTVSLDNGKYEFDINDSGDLVDTRRNDEHWEVAMQWRFSKSIMCMLWRIIELEARDVGELTDERILETAKLYMEKEDGPFSFKLVPLVLFVRRLLATRASEAAPTNSRDYQNGYEQAMHDAGLGVFDGEHATAIKIVHTEAGRTLSKSDFDLCLRIAKRALGVREAAPVAVRDATQDHMKIARAAFVAGYGSVGDTKFHVLEGWDAALRALASQAVPVTQDAQQTTLSDAEMNVALEHFDVSDAEGVKAFARWCLEAADKGEPT